MREIDVSEITSAIKELCIEANHTLSPDMKAALDTAVDTEESPLGKQILGQLKGAVCFQYQCRAVWIRKHIAVTDIGSCCVIRLLQRYHPLF